ncbi:MAG: tRNA epoxyqueuosine(34) reductase QueG [Planctomycetes bacterium]|nr:tRNA epoxyqueuosine(34) reductase QueG [Planctomycetota bacterium]
MNESRLLQTVPDSTGAGIASADPMPREAYLRDWLARGYAGTMGYLHRHTASRVDVRAWLPWAKSVIVVALNYRQPAPAKPDDMPRGRVAMYAWGEDYHVVLRERLEALAAALQNDVGGQFQVCVDTSAILERELAMAAGVGWIGKNTMVMHEELGSYFFLGEIITDLELAPDAPSLDHCGTCTRCLDACPTQAFIAPYQMDASRCIFYLTIEHRSAINPALSAKMDDWVFGCDVCQDVCPQTDMRDTSEPRFRLPVLQEAAPDAAYPLLEDVTGWNEADYVAAVSGKATDRARLDMWRRNAEIARTHSNLGPQKS